MAFYLVKAEVKGALEDLTSLDFSLREARILREGVLTWEEEDYCSPPLAQEREAVLDDYFTGIQVKTVKHGEGWKQVEHLPRLWDRASKAPR